MVIEATSDVLVGPYRTPWIGGPNFDKLPAHARIMRSGKFIDRFPSDWIDKPVRKYLNVNAFYGGPIMNHFGHLMVDSIIRLFRYNENLFDCVIFPRVLQKEETAHWVFPVFDFFNISRDKIIFIDRLTKIESLSTALPGSRLGMGPSSEYLSWLSDKQASINKPNIGFDKIYFGRKHILKKGTLLGETYFVEVLKRNGFEYIIPEHHSIDEQLSFLLNADLVVFMEGSSIYSAELLSNFKAKVFMIPRRPNTQTLFTPHLLPRCKSFKVLGNPSAITRLPNSIGGYNPRSPSIISDPESIHHSLVNEGIVSTAFSINNFLFYEALDRAQYYDVS